MKQLMVNEYIFCSFFFLTYLQNYIFGNKSDKASIFFYVQTLIDLFTLHTIINMTSDIFLMKYTRTIGEPILQIITNWVTTKGTTLGQRGATRDKSTRTEV